MLNGEYKTVYESIPDSGITSTELAQCITLVKPENVTSALSALYYEGYLDRQKVRTQTGNWCYLYARRASKTSPRMRKHVRRTRQTLSNSDVDVINELLEAMARAEPVINKMRKVMLAFEGQ